MKKLKMYTDASYKEGVSTHHYRLLNHNGSVKKRRTMKATEQDSIRAELHSLSEALRYLNQRDIMNVTIHTDCQILVNRLNNLEYNEMGIPYLRLVMKQLNVDVKWITREHKQIVLADYYCGQLMKTVMNRKEYS